MQSHSPKAGTGPGRTLMYALLLFLAGFLYTGCRGPAEPFTIGYAGELSGSRLTPSVLVYRGVMMAVEEWNSRGGIDGRPVELIARDDQGLTEEARRVDRELIALGADALIGHPVSSTSAAVLDLVTDAQLVTLTPTATSGILMQKDDFFFTMYGGNRERAARLARFAVQTLDSKRIAVLLDSANSEYTDNYLTYFTHYLAHHANAAGSTAGISSVVRYGRGGGSEPPGFSALAAELLSGSPDTVLILGSSIDTAKALQQLYKLSWSGPLLASEWASNTELIEQGGPLTGRLFFADIEGLSGTSPSVAGFAARYTERYSEPPSIGAMLGYETADVLFQALSVSGSGGAELKEALLSGRFETVSGHLFFTPSGDVVRDTVIKTVKDGEFVIAE